MDHVVVVGQSGRFYIEDWESDIGDAFEELCD